MAMNLQYISEESVQHFIDGMDHVTTESLLEDPGVEELLTGSVPPQIQEHDNPLGTIESFLHLFIDREEYEVCAKLVEVHPQLCKN